MEEKNKLILTLLKKSYSVFAVDSFMRDKQIEAYTLCASTSFLSVEKGTRL